MTKFHPKPVLLTLRVSKPSGYLAGSLKIATFEHSITGTINALEKYFINVHSYEIEYLKPEDAQVLLTTSWVTSKFTTENVTVDDIINSVKAAAEALAAEHKN